MELFCVLINNFDLVLVVFYLIVSSTVQGLLYHPRLLSYAFQ